MDVVPPNAELPKEAADEILDNAPCGFVSTLPDGLITQVNATFVSWTGMSRQALLAGKRLQDILALPRGDFYDAHLAPLSNAQSAVNGVACELIPSEGEPRPVLVTSSLKLGASGQPLLIRTIVFDATDRVKYERDLRGGRNEAQQFAAIVAASGDAIFSVGLDLVVRTWNPGATRLFDYAESEAVGHTIDELIVPHHLRDERARIYQIVSSGQNAVINETVRHRKDGSLVPVEMNVSPMFDGDGQVAAIIVVVRDNSRRLAADAALRHSERLHRIAFDFAPAGMAHVGPDRSFTRVNAKMCEISGYTENELLGMKIGDLTHPADLAQDSEPLDAFLLGTAPAYAHEKRTVRKDGSIRWVAMTARMVTDDADLPLHSIFVIRDIDERKTAQAALRTSEVRFRRLFEAAHDGVLLLDPDTRRIVDANPFMTTLLGAPRELLIGRDLYEIGFHVDGSANRDMFQTLKATRQVRYENLTLQSDDGVSRVVEVLANLYDEDGRSVIQCNFRDVTERKKAEEALRERERRLRLILDGSLAFIGVMEPDGTLIEANAAALAAGGLSRSDVVGRQLWDTYWFAHDQQLVEQIRNDVARARSGEIVRCDIVVRTQGDTRIAMDFMLSPVHDEDGRVRLLVPSGFDITERKRADTALRQSHDTYLSLIEKNPFGVYLVDADFKLAQVSRGAQDVFGNIDPLLGSNFDEVLRSLWLEPFASEAIGRFRHTLATGEPYRSKDMMEPRGDINAVESYDWQIERVTLPGGRFGVVCYFYDMTDHKRYEEHIKLLLNEVNHRSKNMLAVVQAMVRQTAHSGAPATFELRLSDRIAGLTASHDLLVKNLWRGVDLADLVRSQLAHLSSLLDTRVLIHGPALRLSAAAAQAVGMALHELSTNAAKYGALSNSNGRLQISWTVEDLPKPSFTIQWREEDGPQVAPPVKSGFGQTVIGRIAEQAVDGTVDLDFRSSGLRWQLTAPLERVMERSSHDG